jgi:MGT family glycosyltransferase
MSRFLFVVPPYPSHVFPVASVAHELAQRGHRIAWVTYGGIRPLLGLGAELYPITDSRLEHAAQTLREKAGAASFAGMKALFEDVVVPMARDMLPATLRAIARFRPDVVVSDQMALAGALGARRHGVRWATSATTTALVRDDLAAFPKVEAWLVERYAELQREAGLEPVRWPDRSPQLVLVYFSRLLAGEEVAYPAHYRFVGPAIATRQERTDFPWDRLEARRRVLVTLGSLWFARGERFFRTLGAALADVPVQVIAACPARLLPLPPANFLVREWVPALQVYPHLDAVVTHAGTTVNEALRFGLPAVVAPIGHDQPVFADLAVRAGAAVRVAFNRVGPEELRAAVLAVLDDPQYRAGAARIRDSFIAAGGERAAADSLASLAASADLGEVAP